MKELSFQSVVQDNMRIDWNVPITMEDGVVLRADIFRPDDDGQYPALMTYGPYGKGIHFSDGYPVFWKRIQEVYPEILEGTSGKYMNWETVDPEKWVPHGYVCIRVDSRGAGNSEGCIDFWSKQEAQDIYECIEWAAAQPWSSGKVGLLGISYYGINQWAAAALQPPHLAAICPFEGCNDNYRDMARHGGIVCDFFPLWQPVQVSVVQHGLGSRGKVSRINGMRVSGDVDLSDEELAANSVNLKEEFLRHELNDEYYMNRTTDLSKVTVPVLSCGNWGGNALHLRGNVEGFLRAGSKEKFLEIHGLEHFTEFYTDYGREMQKAFFDHYLKGEDTWHQAPVHLRLRNVDGTFQDVDEQEWPIARTQWTRYYPNTSDMSLSVKPANGGDKSFEAMGDWLTFMTEPLKEDMVIAGPLSAKLYVKSTTEDADIFITVRVFDPDGKDVTFVSASDAHGVVGTGWLRASHRKLDPDKSMPYRPWHTHDEKQPLIPGEIYELDVEIWPTSVNLPAGYRFGFSVGGRDFELDDSFGPFPFLYERTWKGQAMYVHTLDSDSDVFKGTTTLVCDKEHQPYFLVPVIPKK